MGASSARYHQPRRVSTSTSVSCLLHYPFPSPLRRPAVPAPSPKSLPPCTSLQSKRYSTAAADDDGTAGADLVNLARRTLKRKRLALRDDVSSANTHAKEVLQLRKEAGELGKLLDEYDAADKVSFLEESAKEGNGGLNLKSRRLVLPPSPNSLTCHSSALQRDPAPPHRPRPLLARLLRTPLPPLHPQIPPTSTQTYPPLL